MDGRKYQRKSGIKRTLVMLLALVMLASVCFPAMRVNAEETLECNCNAENGVHIKGCPKYVEPQNGGEGDTQECNCNAENGVHIKGCPKYVEPQNGGEGDTQECNCNAENGVHIEGCPKYVEPKNECTCGTETDVHEKGCPLYADSAAEERTLEDMLNEEDYQSVYDAIMACEDDSDILYQYLQEIEDHPNGMSFYDFVGELPEDDQLAFATKLGLVNTYTLEEPPVDELPEDLAFISVQKTFAIDDASKLPAGFQISVGNKNLSLNDEDVEQSVDKLTYTWKVTGLTTGTYTIKETNTKINGYDGPTASVTGSTGGDVLGNGATVTVKAAEGFITGVLDKDNSQGTQEYDLSGGVRLINFKGDKGSTKTVVISKRPLSGSERLAIENKMKDLPGTWTDLNPSYYSLADLELNKEYTFTFDSVEAKFVVTENDKVQVTGNPKTMNQTRGLTVNYSAAENGDIHITNTYKKSTTNVTIEKQVTGNMGDWAKEFTFEVTSNKPMGEGTGYELSPDKKTATFTLKHNGSITLEGVPIGAVLTVTETDADAYEVTINGDKVKNKGETGSAIKSNITVTKDMTIPVVNKNEATIDTGIVTDSIPYILLLTMAVIGAGALLMKKRRAF